jgi:hypothetical protein
LARASTQRRRRGPPPVELTGDLRYVAGNRHLRVVLGPQLRGLPALALLVHPVLPLRRTVAFPLTLQPLAVIFIGAALGANTGTTSYHLRQLEKYGFIEEIPERSSGRERWWRGAQSPRDLRMPAPETLAPEDRRGHGAEWGRHRRFVERRHLGRALLRPQPLRQRRRHDAQLRPGAHRPGDEQPLRPHHRPPDWTHPK